MKTAYTTPGIKVVMIHSSRVLCQSYFGLNSDYGPNKTIDMVW